MNLSRDLPLRRGESAFLIIDVQNYCAHPDGAEVRAIPEAQRAERDFFFAALKPAVKNIARIQHCCRAAGIEVMFCVIENLTQDGRDRGLDYKITGFNVPKGSWDAQVLDAIAPVGDEIVISKTASSVVSYERLQPRRWSAAFNNFAENDREAALRVCPVIGLEGFTAEAQFHVEYRAAAATANPYLQLAVLARAGLQGIRDNEPAPTPTTGDLSLLTNDQLAKIGVVRLPSDLQSALDVLDNERLLRSWFPREFVDVFLAHKTGEIAFLQDKDAADIRRMYADAY